MDNNIKWVNEVKINRTIEALRKNKLSERNDRKKV